MAAEVPVLSCVRLHMCVLCRYFSMTDARLIFYQDPLDIIYIYPLVAYEGALGTTGFKRMLRKLSA